MLEHAINSKVVPDGSYVQVEASLQDVHLPKWLQEMLEVGRTRRMLKAGLGFDQIYFKGANRQNQAADGESKSALLRKDLTRASNSKPSFDIGVPQNQYQDADGVEDDEQLDPMDDHILNPIGQRQQETNSKQNELQALV